MAFFLSRDTSISAVISQIQLFKTVLKIAEYIECYNCVAIVCKNNSKGLLKQHRNQEIQS